MGIYFGGWMGIDFNFIKLTDKYNDYHMFPSKKRKEEIINKGDLDLLNGLKVSKF